MASVNVKTRERISDDIKYLVQPQLEILKIDKLDFPVVCFYKMT